MYSELIDEDRRCKRGFREGGGGCSGEKNETKVRREPGGIALIWQDEKGREVEGDGAPLPRCLITEC